MPWKPKTICRYHSCHELCHDTYCDNHKKQVNKERNSVKGNIYNYRWRKASSAYLKANPLCVHCKREGRLIPATEVDHIISHKRDMKLFWDRKNWQPLCKSCHSKKTALEDSGFGNAPNYPLGGWGSCETPQTRTAQGECVKIRENRKGGRGK